jgi:hypothetical protein
MQIRARQARRRRRTPTLYGLIADYWLTGPQPPYRDVDGDDGVEGVNGRLRCLA